MSEKCHEETCPQITSMGSRRHFVEFQDRLSMRCDKVPEGAARWQRQILSASRQTPSSIRSRGTTSGSTQPQAGILSASTVG
jgi:hypothetical protein